MAQHLLDVADVRAVGQHVGGETVPQHVGRNAFERNPDGGRAFLHDLEDALPRERTAKTRHEHVRLTEIAPREKTPRRGEIGVERATAGSAQRNEPLLRALAEDAKQLAVGDNRVHAEIAEFAHAEAAAIQRLENRAVPQLARVLAAHRLDHREDLLLGQRLRKRQLLLRRLQEFARIVRDKPAPLQVPEEHPDRHRLARPRRPASARATLVL